MSSDDPIYEPGDVVFGADPFKGDDASRPWLVISNHEDRPFHGEQYIALTLTTQSWLDGLIEIPEDAWLRGGTPQENRIAPWSVQSLAVDDIDFWQGTIQNELLETAIAALVADLS